MTDGSLASLYRRHWPELCTYVRRSFGSGPPEPEDVAQAAFLRFAAFDGRGSIKNPRAFLYTMARNIVLDHHRHAKTSDSYAQDVAGRAADECLDEVSPERVLLGRERLDRLLAFLDRLPEQQRRVVMLSQVEEMSVAGIADRFGMSESGVRKQIIRTLAGCLDHLEDPAKEKKP